MRNFITFIMALSLFLAYKAQAQLKPAEGQYSISAGAFTNPSFEQGYKGWTVTGCTKSLESDVPYLNKTLKLACTAETFSIKQEITSMAGLVGNQGLLSCRVKATAAGVRIRSLTDGSETSSIEVNAGDYKRIEIPTVIGGTSNGNEILVDSAYTGDVFIDDCRFALGDGGNIGKIVSISDYTSVASPISTWTASTHTEQWKRVGDELIVSGSITGTSSATALELTVPNSLAIDETKLSAITTFIKIVGQASGNDFGTATHNYRVLHASSTSLRITRFDVSGGDTYVSSVSNTVPFTWNNTTDKITYNYRVPIQGWGNSPQTAAVQNMELTAKTANELSAYIAGNGVVNTENFDWIDGNCSDGTLGKRTCTLKSEVGNSQAMSCQVTGQGGDKVVTRFDTVNSTSFTFDTFTGTGASFEYAAWVVCSKQGADVNKTQTIVGTFENINSSELVFVNAQGGNTSAFSGNVTDIPFTTELDDNYNAFDGAVFTAPRDGSYIVNGAFTANAVVIQYMNFFVNGVFVRNIMSYPTATRYSTFGGTIKLVKGDQLSVRSETSGTRQGSNLYNWITIQELPDTESIIKNLNDNNNVECTTNILAANRTSNGTIADFSETTIIGKKYKLQGQLVFVSLADNGGTIDILDGAAFIGRGYWNPSGTGSSTSTVTPNFCYTATSTSFTMSGVSLEANSYLQGNGSKANTFMQLCKMPDNYICD